MMRRKVRRALDATTGAVLLGFGTKLATEHLRAPARRLCLLRAFCRKCSALAFELSRQIASHGEMRGG